MELQNVIHPEEEYRAFGQLFIDLDPAYEDELEDQDVIDAYNQIKGTAPEITTEQLAQIVPQIAATMKEKVGGQIAPEEQAGKLNALNSVAME